MSSGDLIGRNARNQAEARQREASDPAVSAFVAASAGSGKTKLLTDRLLRLMLGGAEPARIQCLTFTKAGAAEMATRLQQKLGAWVTASAAALDKDLAALALSPTEALRTDARRLFARVLDLPGGMRIGTIHAFCQSLLRRFPLEAALSPYFELLDEVTARSLQRDAREAVLTAPGTDLGAIATIAPQITAEQFSGLLRDLQNRRERLAEAMAEGLPALEAAQRRVLGLADDETEEGILRGAIVAMDLTRLRGAMRIIADTLGGSKKLADKVPAALTWLAAAPPTDLAAWHRWADYFLTQAREPCHATGLFTAAMARAHPGATALLLEEQERVCAVLERLRTAQVARLSAALMRLAIPALAGYDGGKRAAGAVDYADLIGHAEALLHEPGAAWVLYQLDGGLDHLLLDEVQDTAPDQWRIAEALTGEFFAGAGARDTQRPRTIFAVGDHKQSIFSFQGADPGGFDHWRDVLRQRTQDAGAAWRDVTLDVSFRSTTPVLALVDAVFADARATLGLRDQQRLAHFADRADDAGMVEIWPLVPRLAPAEPLPWEPLTAAREPRAAPQILADALAGWIAAQTDGSVMLPSRGRALHAGDILVLVRSRGAFDRALLQALKKNGVPVAGLDRMVLTEQPAVADLLALCDALLLPEDELSLAAVLTSPLGNLADDSLMQLALGRRAGLYATLQERAGERPEWQSAYVFLDALFARVDYISPHALLSEALGRLGGRSRLYARLGPQAGEAIDELLAVAQSYASRHPPSLLGFVQFVREAGAEVKREADGASRELRIMTVHGAKGLQAPLVILPATTGLSERRPTLVWAPDAVRGTSVPLWGPRRDTHDAVMRETLQHTIDAEREEHYRLLYVALTRAEDRLLICGWEPSKPKQECWYDVVRDACAGLAGVERTVLHGLPQPWAGETLRLATEQRAAVEKIAPSLALPARTLPAWAGAAAGWVSTPPPAEPLLPAQLAPSRARDSQEAISAAASPLALRDVSGRRFRRGRLMHSLLQHLPAVPPLLRAAAARDWLMRPGTSLAPGEAAVLAAEAIRLLDDPALAPLFGPDSRAEVPLTGVVATAKGPVVVGGLVDRLAVLADRILIADYKTDRDPPAECAAAPVQYLAQMAAYRAILRMIFPERVIQCALVWTRAGRADWLADVLLDPHAPRAGLPA